MSEGRIAADGQSVIFSQPEMEGIALEVQHSVKSGKPFCADLGLCGVGIVTLPTGQPRIVLQLKHADGTCLSGTLTDSLAEAILECICGAMIEAQIVAEAAAIAKGRAS